MRGWHISVYLQTDEGTSPATSESAEGERLAVWQTGADGLGWIEDLVKKDKAIALGGGGYPYRYTALAKHVIPRIVDNPPGAQSPWLCEAHDILTDKWEGKTVIDRTAAADCSTDSWLLIVAWDES